MNITFHYLYFTAPFKMVVCNCVIGKTHTAMDTVNAFLSTVPTS